MCDNSNFKIFNVATSFTPAMVIENVLGGKAEPKGWAITEVVEKGDGAWAKVSAIQAKRGLRGFDCAYHYLNRLLADKIYLTGNNHRVRRRPRRLLAVEHGLDGQARRQLAACVGCGAQGLSVALLGYAFTLPIVICGGRSLRLWNIDFLATGWLAFWFRFFLRCNGGGMAASGAMQCSAVRLRPCWEICVLGCFLFVVKI